MGLQAVLSVFQCADYWITALRGWVQFAFLTGRARLLEAGWVLSIFLLPPAGKLLEECPNGYLADRIVLCVRGH